MEDNVTVLPGQAEETLYGDVCQIIDWHKRQNCHLP